MATDEKPATPKPDAAKPDSVSKPNEAKATTASARETATAAPSAEKELADLGVDPRLDNRTGDQRPKLVEWPAKPQQIDGPEIGEDFAGHKPEAAEKFDHDADFKAAGAKSEGPHGLGPEGVTVGDEHGKPVEKN